MHGLSNERARGLKQIRLGSAGATDASPTGVRYHSPRDYRSIGLNIIPLVDVTFLLMIFFVIAGSLESWEGVLGSPMLPGASGPSGGELVPLPFSPIIVRLTNDGSNDGGCAIRIDGRPTAPHSFAELVEQLAGLQQNAGFDAQTPVVFVVGDEVRWDHAVNGWNAAIRAGYTKLAFAEPGH